MTDDDPDREPDEPLISGYKWSDVETDPTLYHCLNCGTVQCTTKPEEDKIRDDCPVCDRKTTHMKVSFLRNVDGAVETGTDPQKEPRDSVAFISTDDGSARSTDTPNDADDMDPAAYLLDDAAFPADHANILRTAYTADGLEPPEMEPLFTAAQIADDLHELKDYLRETERRHDEIDVPAVVYHDIEELRQKYSGEVADPE